MPGERLTIAELTEDDLPFLLSLWHVPEVMRYADELPAYRGWRRSDDAAAAWAAYQERRATLGPSYAQLILHLAQDGTPIGESFFAPLPEGFTLDEWRKPDGVPCLIGDIKLLPAYWGRGLGSEGMRLVVRWLYAHTDCALLVVPPHAHNPAATRMYEKAGFTHTGDTRAWRGHRIMELWRAQFEARYGP